MNTKRRCRSTKSLALLCLLSVVLAGCVPIPAPVVPVDARAAAGTPATTEAPAAAPTAAPAYSVRRLLADHRLAHLDPGRAGDGLAETRCADVGGDQNKDGRSIACWSSVTATWSAKRILGLMNRTRKHNHAIRQQELHFHARSVLQWIKGPLTGSTSQVLDYFSESTFENLDDQKEAMTLDDLLTMQLRSWKGRRDDPRLSRHVSKFRLGQVCARFADGRAAGLPFQLSFRVLPCVIRHPATNDGH